MKNIILVFAAILCVCATSFAQKKVPTMVDSAFKTRFSNATNVSWDIENDHEYEAEFKISGAKYSANFSNSGKWLETEQVITFEDLPQLVQQRFMTSHKDAKVKGVSKIETSEGDTNYEIEVKQLLGSEELFYDANGKELQDDDSED
jgi:phage repressor protein C with HTH and peptisase S24 domain